MPFFIALQRFFVSINIQINLPKILEKGFCSFFHLSKFVTMRDLFFFALAGWCGNEIIRFFLKIPKPGIPVPGDESLISFTQAITALFRNPKPDPNGIILGIGVSLIIGYSMILSGADLAASGFAGFASSVVANQLRNRTLS